MKLFVIALHIFIHLCWSSWVVLFHWTIIFAFWRTPLLWTLTIMRMHAIALGIWDTIICCSSMVVTDSEKYHIPKRRPGHKLWFQLDNLEGKGLTLKALTFFIKTLETKGFISIWNHHNCLSQVFLIHLNTYGLGLGPLEIFLLLQCGDPFRRQNLKSIPAL